jgi:hypothetical protein
MSDPLSVFGKTAVVIFDFDDTLCTNDGYMALKDPLIYEILGELRECQISFFCMTSSPATACAGRHGDFELIGLDVFFNNRSNETDASETEAFARPFDFYYDGDLNYFVDGEWNTVFTNWAKGLEYTPWDSFDYHKLPEGTDEQERNIRYIAAMAGQTAVSKGETLESLLNQGFLSELSCIVFIDDNLENIQDMYNSCYSLGISYRGLHLL